MTAWILMTAPIAVIAIVMVVKRKSRPDPSEWDTGEFNAGSGFNGGG